MGGKNLFLGIAYLVVGGLAFLTALAFLLASFTGCFGLIRRRKCARRAPRLSLARCEPGSACE